MEISLSKIAIGFYVLIDRLLLKQLKGEDMKNWIPAMITLFICLLTIGSMFAEVFNVTDVAGFSAALATSSANGESDTINVSAGIYNVSATLNFWSDEDYSLTIIGAGADATILDGGGTTQIMELITASSEGDLTISNMTFRDGNSDYGGGIYLETTSAWIIIDSCDFMDNSATEVGGGANAYSNSGNFAVSYSNFIGNSSTRAGGLFLQSEAGNSISLTYSNFEDNTVTVDGGANMLYPLGPGVELTVEHNTFTNNQSGQFGGGCWVRMPAGEGTIAYHHNTFVGNASTTAGDAGGTYIELHSGTLDYSNNTYIGNSTAQLGGGAWIYCVSGTLDVYENRFTSNNADVNGGGINVGIDEGILYFHKNILDSNTADNVGGGLSVATTSGNTVIFNNTFYANSADEGGGLYAYFDASTATSSIHSNIFWHDSSPSLAGSGALTILAEYCDIEGGTGEPWFGTGCIDADPLFVSPSSGNFRLGWLNFPTDDATKSPCIDAGDPSSPHDPDGTRADMGAIAYNQVTAIYDQIATPNRMSISAFPNPFNSAVTISLDFGSDPAERLSRIEIFDVNGRRISVIPDPDRESRGVAKNLDSRFHGNDRTFVWQPDETVGSGAYLIRATAGEESITKRVVYLK